MFDLGHLPTLVWRNLTLSFQCLSCSFPSHGSSITYLSTPIGCAFWECPKIHFYKQCCNKSTAQAHRDIHILCISKELQKWDRWVKGACADLMLLDSTQLRCHPTGVPQVHSPTNGPQERRCLPVGHSRCHQTFKYWPTWKMGGKSYNLL